MNIEGVATAASSYDSGGVDKKRKRAEEQRQDQEGKQQSKNSNNTNNNNTSSSSNTNNNCKQISQRSVVGTMTSREYKKYKIAVSKSAAEVMKRIEARMAKEAHAYGLGANALGPDRTRVWLGKHARMAWNAHAHGRKERAYGLGRTRVQLGKHTRMAWDAHAYDPGSECIRSGGRTCMAQYTRAVGLGGTRV